jgi:hypothetical protein
MYSQPDFTSVESRLESSCRVRGFHVIFVPKYRCELNSLSSVGTPLSDSTE